MTWLFFRLSASIELCWLPWFSKFVPEWSVLKGASERSNTIGSMMLSIFSLKKMFFFVSPFVAVAESLKRKLAQVVLF